MSKLRIALFLSAVASAASLGVACGSSSSSSNGGGSSSSGGASSSGGSSSGTSSSGASSSSGAASSSSGGSTEDAGFVQASHLAFPGVVYEGAPLVTAPKVVTITFAGDSIGPHVSGFGAVAASSSNWWPTVMSQYCTGSGTGCIGDGPAGTSVGLDAGAPTEVNDPSNGLPDDAGAGGGVNLQTFLQGLMAAGTVPAPDAQTIYAIYLPANVTFNGISDACDNAFEGYHSEGTYKGTNYVYAIILECTDGVSTVQDNATDTAAHEIAETASDGYSTDSTGGYYIDFNDPNTWAWNDDDDGEIADLCVDYYDLGQDHWTEGSYLYQRIWSVEAAAANQNPCSPIPTGEVYFNAAPASAFLEANVGETITVEVDAFSDAPRGEWTVLAQDFTDPTGATTYTNLSFGGVGGQPITTVNNGSKVQLSITLTQDPSNVYNGAADNYAGEADVVLWSYETPDGGADISTASAGHYWPLAIMARYAAQDAGVTLLDGGVPLERPHQARPFGAQRRLGRPQHAQRLHLRPGFTR